MRMAWQTTKANRFKIKLQQPPSKQPTFAAVEMPLSIPYSSLPHRPAFGPRTARADMTFEAFFQLSSKIDVGSYYALPRHPSTST
ncbi:hypothetical protein L1887_59519 [Cichorium endivia]|nr:hypothetical protein L1887_59519 [Cichorium endivia]